MASTFLDVLKSAHEAFIADEIDEASYRRVLDRQGFSGEDINREVDYRSELKNAKAKPIPRSTR